MIHIAKIFNNEDGTYNLSVQYDQKTIRLHSSRPYAEAQKIFQQLSSPPLYFIGGLGYGYLLEHILKNSTAQCLVYEPISPIFSTAKYHRTEIQQFLDNPRVTLVQNIEQLEDALHQLNITDIGFSVHRPYAEMFQKEFTQAKKSIEQIIRKKEVGNATLKRFGKIWTKNLFKNMHRFFHSRKLISLKGIGQFKPAIIVGAGPSLADSLPYLKEAQDKAFIIACDTSLPMLEAENIKVDFVVTVDAQEKNAFYLRYTKNKDHFLVADPSVHESTFEGYDPDRIILMDSAFPLYQYFEPFWGSCGLLESGGSVSTSAFDLAVQMTCDPIIMIGQDLAFTKAKTHNKGHVLSEISRTGHHRLKNFHTIQSQITYPNHIQLVQGRQPNSFVQADARFILYRDWFAHQIPQCNASIIVVGMEGAFIEGAYHLPPQDTFSLLSSKIEKVIPSATYTFQKQAYSKMLDQLHNSVSSFIPKCRTSLQLVKQAYQADNLHQAQAETSKLQQLLHHPDYKQISPLVSVAMQESVQKALSLNNQTTPKEHLQIMLDMCEEMYYGLLFLERMMKKAQLLALDSLTEH